MKLPKLLLSIIFCSSNLYFAYSQHSIAQIREMQSTPRSYPALKINETIHLDGKDHEAVWEQAPWSDEFIDIIGTNGHKPIYPTRIKMLWDDHHLYIYALLEEPHVWADIQKHDEIIYHNNDFEVFIKPFAHQPTYYEIEVNPLNTILDLIMARPYRFDGEALIHWDMKGLKSAINIEGTLNDPNDIDRYWSVEMAIPFESIYAFGKGKKPQLESYWQINFSRVQWKHTIENNHYTRKKINGKLMEEENWVWSPIGIINMHYPERWGYIQFVDKLEKFSALPSHYAMEKFAWNVHYLQGIFFDKHKKFSSSIQQLEGYKEFLENHTANYEIDLLTNKTLDFYRVSIQERNTNKTISLDAHGNINY